MKILKEDINTFNRDSENKLSSLGVGKIQLIKDWLKKSEIKNYIINDDFSIDVNDSVIILEHAIKNNLPDYIHFNNINGTFDISLTGITTLKGCPKRVDFNFYCTNNNLTSLEYAPEYIGFNCFCQNNYIPKESIVEYKQSGAVKLDIYSDYFIEKISIDESFKKSDNKLGNIGIGKATIIKSWLEKYEISDYVINDDFSIDVGSIVRLEGENLKELPNFIKFNEVLGFDVAHNYFSDTIGFPKMINTWVDMEYNDFSDEVLKKFLQDTFINGTKWFGNQKNKED